MQLWRMRPGGSEQQQVTNDGFNNWFPHISPVPRVMRARAALARLGQ